MKRRTILLPAALVAGSLILPSADCNDAFRIPPANEPPDPVTLEAIPPAGPSPLTVQFRGFATDSDGTVRAYRLDFGDGTAADDPNTSHTYTTPSGFVFTATLVARDDDGGIGVAVQKITVNGGTGCNVSQPTVSFERDVVPLLGPCAQSGCHAVVGNASSPVLTATADDYEEVFAYVNLNDPPASLLLRQTSDPSFGHSGGQLWPVGSDAYNTVRTWIEECATDN